MTRGAGLEIDAVLPLERDLAVVQTAREEHGAVNADERIAVQTRVAILGHGLLHFHRRQHVMAYPRCRYKLKL